MIAKAREDPEPGGGAEQMPGRRYGGIQVGRHYVRVTRRHQTYKGGGNFVREFLSVLGLGALAGFLYYSGVGLGVLVVGVVVAVALGVGWFELRSRNVAALREGLRVRGATGVVSGKVLATSDADVSTSWRLEGSPVLLATGVDAVWATDGHAWQRFERPVSVSGQGYVISVQKWLDTSGSPLPAPRWLHLSVEEGPNLAVPAGEMLNVTPTAGDLTTPSNDPG